MADLPSMAAKQFTFRLKENIRKRVEALQERLRPKPTITQIIDDALETYLDIRDAERPDAKPSRRPR